MSEFYINLFAQEDYAGTNRPHFRATLKIDGVDHECALWPNKDGKKGFSGKAKPKVPYVKPQESVETGALEEVQRHFPGAKAVEDDGDLIPF